MSVKEFRVPSSENIDSIRARMPAFARDISLNLSSVMAKHSGTGLNQKQIFGAALAVALCLKSNLLVQAIIGEAQDQLSDGDIEAAKIAASMATMNAVYFNFVERIADDEFKMMPARLRVNMSKNPGVPKLDYDLYALAVFTALGSSDGYHVETKEILRSGITKVGVQQIAKIASVIKATDCVLSI